MSHNSLRRMLDGVAGAANQPLYHYRWTTENRVKDAQQALDSPLLALTRTSDVNDIEAQQICDARAALLLNADAARTAARLLAKTRSSSVDTAVSMETSELNAMLDQLQRRQREIVERFLAGRHHYFGAAQCAPFDEAEQLVREGRDMFVVVKFMDEAPHLESTVNSILNQKDFDLGRLVVVLVDNNSLDGSDAIVKRVAEEYHGQARIISVNQPKPGGGNTARFGVDRTIATIHQMCLIDGDWSRLHWSYIGVSDGDTVYHPRLLGEIARLFRENPLVDGVMPFLTYKLTAALRLFRNYRAAALDALRPRADAKNAVAVPLDLTDSRAHGALPRRSRRRCGPEVMEVSISGKAVRVPLTSADEHGRRFGTLHDSSGNLAFLLEDGTLVLDKAPPVGPDAALVFLENGQLEMDEKWRWHSVIGHDLFLWWAFEAMGLPEEMVYPDTSDALKMFRTWSFAIGGQHQLRRLDVPIVTGTDYQSGRVLQITGNVVRLGPACACAETETDRLTKMVRNFANQWSVLYGQTRGHYIERASGFYSHLTRVQADIEAEIRSYPDEFFRDVVFPERILFPLRWILQNAIRFFAHPEPEARRVVRERVLETMFGREVTWVERTWFHDGTVDAIARADFSDKQAVAEKIAEEIIRSAYRPLMRFYVQTLRACLDAHDVPPNDYGWLLEAVESSRNAAIEERPQVHPLDVWPQDQFVIDPNRGQVVRIDSSARDTTSTV